MTLNGGGLEDANIVVYGGSATDLATGNTVTVNNFTGLTFSPGSGESRIIDIAGGVTSSGDATDNTVIINNGIFGDPVISGGSSTSGDAVGNTVFINGGTFGEALIYGGATNSGNATGNTVTLAGTPDLTKGYIIGGFTNSGDAFNGNTLNVKTSGLTVATIESFEHLNFYLPTTLAAGNTILTVTESAYLTENTDGTGRSSQVHVGIDGGSSPLQIGNRVTLIDAGGATGDGLVTNSGLNITTKGEGMQGVTLQYEFDVMADTAAGLLTATVTAVGANEQAKALSEGFSSAVALTMQGADLAAGQGMANAVTAAGGSGSGSGFGSFGGLSGGSVRLNTGSHVDMNSVSLMTGLAWGVDTTPGRLTLGAFVEYGNGSYDTHKSFSNSASVDGDGDTWYLGGGVLGRLEFPVGGTRRTGRAAAALSRAKGDGFEPGFTPGEETSPTASAGTESAAPSVIYVEASARMGKAHNEYNSSDLQVNNVSADYDSSSLYYGLHLGTGYIWNITERASLDLYGKYFWTRQEGDSVTLSTEDPVTFKDADSHRLRLGTRFAYAVNEYISPYIGAAYEHEFDGKARATSNGFALDAPSLKGDTGIGEIGLTFTPSLAAPLSFDLGLQGYTGKREGVTGTVQLRLEF